MHLKKIILSLAASCLFLTVLSSCKVEIEKIYLCPVCYTEHGSSKAASDCCTSTEENPASDVSPANLKIAGRNFGKTEFVTVIPKGKTATIHRENDTDANGRDYSDVFYSGRKVTLSHYMICKYEVTNELYEHVMGKLYFPDEENRYGTERQKYRPAAGVSWYDAVIFCNKLSELCGYDKVYEISDIKYSYKGKPNEYVYSATVTWDFSKNGYRLPTEAEWEYAARGALNSETDWKYRFSGADNAKLVGWTSVNSAGAKDTDYILKTHEVGMKSPNALGLYDMSGNVTEWCMDYFRTVTENGDTAHGNRVNDKEISNIDPCLGKGKYANVVLRGGSYKDDNGYATMWQRLGKPRNAGHGFSDSENYQGIRLVRRDN